jgi:hypothetical protein
MYFIRCQHIIKMYKLGVDKIQSLNYDFSQ